MVLWPVLRKSSLLPATMVRDLHPRTDFIFSPHVGAVYQYGNLRFRLNYAYMDLNLANMSNNWCSLSLELLINRKKGTLRQTPVTGI